MKLKKGDTVIIIAGKDRGKTGQIEAVLPTENRVVITAINEYKKHVRRSAQNPNGGVITKVRPIHASNVMALDAELNKPTRLGYTTSNGEKVRVSRLTGKPMSKGK